MKKRLLISNNNGMILPLTLLILPVFLIILYTNIELYYYDIQFATNQTEQLKIESLTQASIAKYKNDINLNDAELPKTYNFPQGFVQIIPTSKIIDHTQTIDLVIKTNNNYNYQATITIKLTNH